MQKLKILIIVLLLSAAPVLFGGCQEKGPAERTGEQVDDAFSDLGQSFGEALDEAGDRLDEAGDRVSD